MTLTTSDFGIGDMVLFGRTHGEKTLGRVVKVNGKKLKVEQVEERGSSPVGALWGVPPSLCTKVTGSVTVPVSTKIVTPPAPKPTTGLEDPATFAVKAKKLGLPAGCLGKWINLNRTTRLQITGLETSRPKYPVNMMGTQGGKYKMSVLTVRACLAVES